MLKSDIKNEIINTLRPFKPEKIILFGSHVYGSPGQSSDIDLFFIKEVPKEQVRELRLKIKKTLWEKFRKKKIKFDILVDSENRIQQRIEMGDMFYEEIINKGKTIYA